MKKEIEQMDKDMEELQRKIDAGADPFLMLFGWKHRSGYGPQYVSTESFRTEAAQNKSASPPDGEQKKHESDGKWKVMGKQAVKGGASGHSSQTPKSKASAVQDIQSDDFEFDPITMRKVPRKSTGLASAPERIPDKSEIDIPIKRFETPTVDTAQREILNKAVDRKTETRKGLTTMEVSSSFSAPESHSWLAQEGFSAVANSVKPPDSGLSGDHQVSGLKQKGSGIESSLARYLANKDLPPKQDMVYKSKLNYPTNENKAEDIDLLRSSNVRASSGRLRRAPNESAKLKQDRRAYLEENFKKRYQQPDAYLDEERVSQDIRKTNKNPAEILPTEPQPDNTPTQVSLEAFSRNEIGDSQSGVTTDDGCNHLTRSRDISRSSEHDMKAHRRDAVEKVHEEEVKAQKAALEAIEVRSTIDGYPRNAPSLHFEERGEGDLASNVHEFARTDRWYKKKAPYVIENIDSKHSQLARDAAPAREIRRIYEDRHGVIDTNHRQPSRQAIQTDEQQSEITKSVGKDSSKGDDRNTVYGSLQQSSVENPSKPVPSYMNPSSITNLPTQDTQRLKESPALEMIRKFFDDLPLAQVLSKGLQKQAGGKDLTGAVSTDLGYSKSAHEILLIQSLKGVWNLFKASESHKIGKPQDDQNNASSTHTGSVRKDSDSQPSLKATTEDSPHPSKLVAYKVLAYDHSTQRVFTAKPISASSPPFEKPLTVVEALCGLTHPAKFLPHVTSLQNEGYEIVSGRSNILVFRKIEHEKAALVSPNKPSQTPLERYSLHTNPIDGTTTQTGNFASPTGFVNHDSILPPSDDLGDQEPAPLYGPSSKLSATVRREEPVFSGSRKGWQDYSDEGKGIGSKLKTRKRRAARRKKTLKRIVWVGTFMAGCCYAVGVVSETLRAR